MPQGRTFPFELYQSIRAMLALGHSEREIIEALHKQNLYISKGVINKAKHISKKVIKTTITKNKQKSKISERGMRAVRRTVRQLRNAPVKTIVHAVGLDIHRTTLNRAMNKDSYLVYKKAYKVGKCLSKEDKKKRIEWATNMNNMGIEWEDVFFCDEKTFMCDGRTVSQKLWIDRRDPVPKHYLRSHGGGSIKVWTGISKEGLAPIEFITANTNQKDYAHIIEKHIPKSCEYIQHDNWPVHTAIETRETLESMGIQPLRQPAWSSDLQPAEQVLAVLSNEVYKRNKQYINVDQLKTGIKAAMKRIHIGETESGYNGKSLFSKLAQGMSARMLACIANKGDHIRLDR